MYQYYRNVLKIADDVFENEQESINNSVNLLFESVMNKNAIYIFGASHAGILSEEMYYRAGGSMLFNPIFSKELMLDNKPISKTSQMEQLDGYGRIIGANVNFKANDVIILHSVSGRNPVIIDLAHVAKENNVKIIALTNLEYSKSVESRHKSGKNLYQLADIVIDNHGDIGDATCQIKGLEQKVGPTSTVIGAMILNTIVVELTQKLVESGMENPPIFYSANIDGGSELNKQLFEEYRDIIHYEL